MRNIFSFLLLLNFSSSFASNLIIATVDDHVITLNSITKEFNEVSTYDDKIKILNNRINVIIQLKKTREFGISPSEKDISKVLLDLSSHNKISTEQLYSYPEIELLKKEIFEKLAILNLQQYLTQNLKTNLSNDELLQICPKLKEEDNISQIKIAQIVISKLENSNSKKSMENAIKDFLSKISKHIRNGASFETLAKLHSQHPSYINGGISEWINIDTPLNLSISLLQNGEVSSIFSSNYGFGIAIKVDERQVNSGFEKCKYELNYKYAEEYYLKWLSQLRDKASIKIFNSNF